MHHYRIDLSGPPAAVSKAIAEIGQPRNGTTVIVAREEGVDFWESRSLRHPRVTFGIECFEAFEDELLHVVIQNGGTTEMARESVLPSNWGSFHDEDGEPIDEARLRMAAEWVAEHRLRYDVGTLESGLATALTMGKALGRICSRVEETMYNDATPDALDAVVELAVFAWWASASGSHGTAAELEFDHALRLTQSTVHAGRSEFRDDDDWDFWLRCLVGAASNVIDCATEVWLEPENELHALGSEHFGTPLEHLEIEARSLLTTCVETLALFGDGVRPHTPVA